MRSHSCGLRKFSSVYSSSLSQSILRRLAGLRRMSGGVVMAPRSSAVAARPDGFESHDDGAVGIARACAAARPSGHVAGAAACRDAGGPAQSSSTCGSWFIASLSRRTPGRRRWQRNHLVMMTLYPEMTGSPQCMVALLGVPSGLRLFQITRHAERRLEGVIELGEARAAAFHALVQVHHEAPGAVAAGAAEAQEFTRAGFEVVPVRLELLATS